MAHKSMGCLRRVVCARRFLLSENSGLPSPKTIWRCIHINEPMINEEIRDREVRLISADGEQLGVMPTRQALEMAEQAGLDLVKIAANAQPPVCKLMDYDKHRYEQSKRERDLRKNQRVVTLKEVQLSDVQTKFRNAVKFLQDGDKVKVSIRFRGRQIAHADIGMKIMQDFASRIEEYGTIERRPMLEGRHMILILGPKAEKKSFAEKSQARKEKHAANQAAATEAPREPKPQPKKKVKRESENMI